MTKAASHFNTFFTFFSACYFATEISRETIFNYAHINSLKKAGIFSPDNSY